MSSVNTTTPATVPDNNKIIFVALGALFGLALITFATHMVCVKCLLRGSGEDDIEETGSLDEFGRRRRRFRSRRSQFTDEDLEDVFSSGRYYGLDKSIVELLPIFVFDPEAPFKDVVDCSVCLGEFEEGERGRYLPKCGHCFHVECIDMWFLSHSSCPLCRREITLSPLLSLGPDIDDQNFTRSLSCPQYFAHRSHPHVWQDPLSFDPMSDSMRIRFRDLIEETSDAGPSSPRVVDTATRASSTVAITIPEIAPTDDISEISVDASTPEESCASSPSGAVTVQIDVADDDVAEQKRSAEKLEPPKRTTSSSSSPSEAVAVQIDVADENVAEKQRSTETELAKLTTSNSCHRYVDHPSDESISGLPVYCDR